MVKEKKTPTKNKPPKKKVKGALSPKKPKKKLKKNKMNAMGGELC